MRWLTNHKTMKQKPDTSSELSQKVETSRTLLAADRARPTSGHPAIPMVAYM